jgi:nitrogen fixation NifU-like protein
MPSQESQNTVQFDDLYRDLILDHYRNPRNKGVLDDAGVVVEGFNPSCGDEISLGLRRSDGSVDAVRFSGQGCSISQSSASMLAEQIEGRPLDEIRELSRTVQQMLADENFDVDAVDLGDLEALQGVARFPVRIKCALLAWKVLDQALDKITGAASNSGDDTDIQTRVATAKN